MTNVWAWRPNVSPVPKSKKDFHNRGGTLHQEVITESRNQSFQALHTRVHTHTHTHPWCGFLRKHIKCLCRTQAAVNGRRQSVWSYWCQNVSSSSKKQNEVFTIVVEPCLVQICHPKYIVMEALFLMLYILYYISSIDRSRARHGNEILHWIVAGKSLIYAW